MNHTDIFIALAYLKPEQCIHKSFDFSKYNDQCTIKKKHKIPNCGTAGCLAGELPGLTKDWYFNEAGRLKCKSFEGYLECEAISLYFGIPYEAARYLFHAMKNMIPFIRPETINPLLKGIELLDDGATLQEVQANLKIFLTNLNIQHGDNN